MYPGSAILVVVQGTLPGSRALLRRGLHLLRCTQVSWWPWLQLDRPSFSVQSQRWCKQTDLQMLCTARTVCGRKHWMRMAVRRCVSEKYLNRQSSNSPISYALGYRCEGNSYSCYEVKHEILKVVALHPTESRDPPGEPLMRKSWLTPTSFLPAWLGSTGQALLSSSFFIAIIICQINWHLMTVKQKQTTSVI